MRLNKKTLAVVFAAGLFALGLDLASPAFGFLPSSSEEGGGFHLEVGFLF